MANAIYQKKNLKNILNYKIYKILLYKLIIFNIKFYILFYIYNYFI